MRTHTHDKMNKSGQPFSNASDCRDSEDRTVEQKNSTLLYSVPKSSSELVGSNPDVPVRLKSADGATERSFPPLVWRLRGSVVLYNRPEKRNECKTKAARMTLKVDMQRFRKEKPTSWAQSEHECYNKCENANHVRKNVMYVLPGPGLATKEANEIPFPCLPQKIR
jgi:hypothetical protein